MCFKDRLTGSQWNSLSSTSTKSHLTAISTSTLIVILQCQPVWTWRDLAHTSPGMSVGVLAERLTGGLGAHCGCEWELCMTGAPACIGKIGGWRMNRSKPLPLLPGCRRSVSSGFVPSVSALPVLMECLCPNYEPMLLLKHLAPATRQWLVQRLTKHQNKTANCVKAMEKLECPCAMGGSTKLCRCRGK